jgi:enterochelin esterase-like enzyme
MTLTGSALVTVLVVLAIGAPPLVAAAAWRMSRGWLRGVLTLVGVLLCQGLAIGAAGVLANNQFGFYNSWSELLGHDTAPTQAPTTNRLVPKDGSLGTVVTLSVPLSRSASARRRATSANVLVWLPKEYRQPQYRTVKFPVTMMLPGQPSSPQAAFHQFDFARQATQAIETHRVKPFVAVFPPLMIAPPRDTECTDVPHGPQAESWLFRSVRAAVIRSMRVTVDGRQWSAIGWSTGGFCAAKLILRHPTLFHAAVGIGAYYDAETDKTTGDLFGGNRRLRNQNSPIWLVQRRPGAVRLLIIVSQLDRASYNGYAYANSKQMIEATQGTPGVATLVLPKGGHNYKVYRPTVPEALTWLGKNAAL